jgi:hypothetical protein
MKYCEHHGISYDGIRQCLANQEAILAKLEAIDQRLAESKGEQR